MEQQELEHKFEEYRKRLQDLSGRNRLLNFKDSNSRTLRILDPGIGPIWRAIDNERTITFPVPDMDDLIIEEENGDEPTAAEAGERRERLRREELRKTRNDWEIESRGRGGFAIPASAVACDKTIKAANKVLRTLRRAANASIEEQGINILYLGFGLLTWSGVKSAKGMQQAPLVMVPVNLALESVSAPFVLSRTDDEIVANPTIAFALSEQYGIKLPEFDGDLKGHLDLVRNAIRHQPDWEVSDDVVLSTFQFQKLTMYNDLEKHREDILAHPVVKAILGDPSDLPVGQNLRNYDHDKGNPKDDFEVVDADSSQMDAIALAREGVSFVLQGPPGTGKSQTITNIISVLINEGKTVLFVSEKKAALDVVYNRLKKVNLGDFCLVMHGTKTAKKEVLRQLGETLELSGKKPTLTAKVDVDLDSLERSRSQLNAYAHQVYQYVEPLHIRVFDANAYIAALESADVPNLDFSIHDVATMTSAAFHDKRAAVADLANCVKRFTTSPDKSPWNGSNVTRVTNQLRNDVRIRLVSLSNVCDNLAEEVAKISTGLHITVEPTVPKLTLLIDFLRYAGEGPSCPRGWAADANFQRLREECSRESEVSGRRDALINAINDETVVLTREDILSAQQLPNINPSTRESLEPFGQAIKKLMDSDSCFKAWSLLDLKRYNDTVRELKELVTTYQRIKDELLDSYEYEILDFDFKLVETRFKTQYTSVFKRLGSQHRHDLKSLRALKKDASKVTDDEAVDLLFKLRKLDDAKRRIEENADTYSAMLPSFYRGIDTNLDAVEDKHRAFQALLSMAASVRELHDLLGVYEDHLPSLEKDFGGFFQGWSTDWQGTVLPAVEWAQGLFDRAVASGINDQGGLGDFLVNPQARVLCFRYAEEVDKLLDESRLYFEWYASLFDSPDDILASDVRSLWVRARTCATDVTELETWADYRAQRNRMQDMSLNDCAERLVQSKVPPELYVRVFEKRFYWLWLDAITPLYPAILGFREDRQEETIRSFSKLDMQQFQIAQARIRANLISRLPAAHSRSVNDNEIGILRRELAKKSRIMPVRTLFATIPELVQRLKPCMMMSPLSVSTFLQSNAFKFDVVIFDEASQVRTEDAIGAISRGAQAIIAGDSKQLPPTSFFEANLNSGDEYLNESEDVGAYDSVLDEANQLESETLQWHYRSRDENLISFSNIEIYNGSLVTFPSSIERAKDHGVEYVYVSDGVYEGGRKGNRKEAERVADLVFAHFDRYGFNRSLGIIAFGEQQSNLIENVIRARRLEDSSYEAFFSEDLAEPFFVKNLENVQGDERDTIILCVGYAKSPTGTLRLNFGPLSLAGGERRLNVAVTRAKRNLKLVTSLDANDIDTSKVSNEGPRLLRAYLDFAKRGKVAIVGDEAVDDEPRFNSMFEQTLYSELISRGYDVATQVGSSAYRIDLAVRYPEHSSSFVMGIVCDGDSYHKARTARDRDRLRESVLVEMGWNLYRVWSTDWIKDPDRELGKLLSAIEQAIKDYGESFPDTVGEGWGVCQTADANDAQLPEKVAVDDSMDSSKNDLGFYLTMNNDVSPADSGNPYGFGAYQQYSFDAGKGDRVASTYAIHIIEVEGPIEETKLFRAILDKCYPERKQLSSSMRNTIAISLRGLRDVTRFKDGGGQYFYYSTHSALYGLPREGMGRTIKEIPDVELAYGMLAVARELVGATLDSLVTETAVAFGFKRRGKLVRATLERVLDELVAENKLIIAESGKIVVAD